MMSKIVEILKKHNIPVMKIIKEYEPVILWEVTRR